MFEEKKKTIDEIVFGVTPFSAIEAIKLQAYLLKLFGPTLATLIGAFQKKNVDGELEIDGGNLGNSLQLLFNQLDEDSLLSLIKRLFKNVICEHAIKGNAATVFDFGDKFEERMTIVFQGRLLLIYKVIVFVLEVNYPDFFEKIGSVFGTRLRTVLSPEAKPEEPTK